MADDVTFQSATPATPPAATVIATDDVGGKHYQRIKLDLGADGAAAPAVGSLPVSDNGGSLTVDGPLTDAQLRAVAVPVSGTVTTTLGTGTANIGDVDVLTLPKGSKTITSAAPTTAAASVLAANANRKSATILNAHATLTVYLGASGAVTTANGLPLAAGASLADAVSTDAWFAIMASGTGDLRIVEVA